jgi:hypothetical protein
MIYGDSRQNNDACYWFARTLASSQPAHIGRAEDEILKHHKNLSVQNRAPNAYVKVEIPLIFRVNVSRYSLDTSRFAGVGVGVGIGGAVGPAHDGSA